MSCRYRCLIYKIWDYISYPSPAIQMPPFACCWLADEPYDEALGEGYRASPQDNDKRDPKPVWVHA
jgi:hypothetical protein